MLLLVHRLQHERAPRNGARHAHRRRIHRRRIDEAGQERRFGQIEVGGRLAEVAARGGLGAVQAVAEVHLVEVKLEDLVLRVHPLDADGEGDFPDLSP